MDLKEIVLIAILILGVVRSEDYALEEDEEMRTGEENSEKVELSFLKDFSCLAASNQFLSRKQAEIMKFQESSAFGLNIKRLRAALFKRCLFEIDEEKMMEISRARNPSDIEKIDFPFLSDIQLEEFLALEKRKLDEEEKQYYKRLTKTEEKLKDMQKKNQKEDLDKENSEKESWDEVRNQKADHGIMFIPLDNQILLWFVAGGFLILSYIGYKAWGTLFKGENYGPKNQHKLKKGNHVPGEKSQKVKLPKNFFKKEVPKTYFKK